MAEKSVIEIASDYAKLVSANMSVKQILLFGSYARGTASLNSDIDIAVILKNEPDNVWKTEAELYRLAGEIDLRIEPVLTDDINDPSGFWEEISKYGQVVYSDTNR